MQPRKTAAGVKALKTAFCIGEDLGTRVDENLNT